jgi:type IV secretory pathway TrbL component
MKNMKVNMILLAGVLLLPAACTRSQEHSGDADSAAGKSGKVAYTLSKKTAKAAKEIGRESEEAAKVIERKTAEAARDAHKGWKDAAEEDKAKHDR